MQIRLCYCSQRVETENDLLSELADILQTSRQFNAQHAIYGVLFYAQGNFFQCLEGEQATVEALFQKICQDQRHTQIQQFVIQPIQQLHFKQWSMRYVKSQPRILKFYRKMGLDGFAPQQLQPQQLEEFVELLFKIRY